MTRSSGDIEPHEGIDPFDNAETRAVEHGQSSALGRSSTEGPPPTEAPRSGTMPEISGTAAGDALAGTLLDEDEAEQAVSGDTGPEHPGTRRSS
jgi:hypothetical protein